MSKRKSALGTLAIHGGAGAHHAGDPVAPPLVQSVNFVQEIGTDAGLLYTRYGNTPNLERVQKRLALIEGAEAALLLASGMGATACAMLALLRPGCRGVSLTGATWPSKARIACPVPRSHTLSVASAEPETATRPSAVTAALSTAPACPLRV